MEVARRFFETDMRSYVIIADKVYSPEKLLPEKIGPDERDNRGSGGAYNKDRL